MYGQVPVPVCRYYIPPESGDSHFFSASAKECAEVAAKFPTFVKETDAAFFVVLPDETPGPVRFRAYRCIDSGTSAPIRITAIYVNDLARRMEMMKKGWMPEGFGPAGVAWCI